LLTAFTFVAPGEFTNNPSDLSGTTTTTIAVSNQEIEDLVYMREEEKLAHDVYIFLYSRWELPIFSNIAASELTHTNAVLSLLERYGIDDPAKDLQPGEFKNQDLQTLYNQLITTGSKSLERTQYELEPQSKRSISGTLITPSKPAIQPTSSKFTATCSRVPTIICGRLPAPWRDIPDRPTPPNTCQLKHTRLS
jgi:hypothetical protein